MGKKKNKIRPQAAKPLVVKDEKRNFLILGLIITFTTCLFAKSLYYTFIGYDDPQYVIDNTLIRDLSPAGIKNIFSTPVIGMYNPLTFIVYSVEYKMFGLDPKGYHFFNLLFHLIATLLCYKFILRLTRRYETAAIVSLLFAIHPMHVSVVTWISQTKTSLCVIFYFAALIQYIRYIKDGYEWKRIAYVILFFLLAVLSKPSAVTLAPMLCLIDYYTGRKIDRRLILEKVPVFLFSLIFGIITLMTHSEDSIFKINEGYSILHLVLIANYSVVFYIHKFLLPFDLSVIYPYPEAGDILPLQYYLSIPVIPLIFYLVYKAKMFRKEIVFGILFFLISISVMLRIVPSGYFGAANRYSYLSYTGLFFILAQFITYTIDNKFSFAWKLRRFVIPAISLMILFLSLRTNTRVEKWKDSITLFTDVINKYPNASVAYANRGYAKSILGDHAGAMDDYNASLKLEENNTQCHLNRGLALTYLQRFEEAILDFNRVIELDPKAGAAYFDRALLHSVRNDTIRAISDFKMAKTLGIAAAEAEISNLRQGIRMTVDEP
jgi:hypothetical protein